LTNKIPVDDHSNEVLRKAAQDSSDGTKYDLRMVTPNVVDSKLDEEYRLRTLNMLKSINKNLAQIERLLEGIASE
jgi:hypothetical protein